MWVLLLAMWVNNGVTSQQIQFETKALCIAAGTVATKVGYSGVICMQVKENKK